jgi:hypothetical protein
MMALVLASQKKLSVSLPVVNNGPVFQVINIHHILRRQLGRRRCAQVNTNRLLDGRAPKCHRKLPVTTQARAVTVAASLFRYWTDTGYLAANPAAGVVRRSHAAFSPQRILPPHAPDRVGQLARPCTAQCNLDLIPLRGCAPR